MALANIDALNEVTLAVLPLREPLTEELIAELHDRNVELKDIETRYNCLDDYKMGKYPNVLEDRSHDDHIDPYNPPKEAVNG